MLTALCGGGGFEWAMCMRTTKKKWRLAAPCEGRATSPPCFPPSHLPLTFSKGLRRSLPLLRGCRRALLSSSLPCTCLPRRGASPPLPASTRRWCRNGDLRTVADPDASFRGCPNAIFAASAVGFVAIVTRFRRGVRWECADDFHGPASPPGFQQIEKSERPRERAVPVLHRELNR